jgi:peptidoglycan/xylan/chitin deacetylase (PgdA/CDA1 family)
VTLFVTTGFVDGQLWLWWDRVAYLFRHTQRCALLLDLGGQTRPYSWSTPDERERVQQDLLSRLEWIPAPEREATIASLSRHLDVELPERPPAACAPITWAEVRSVAKRGATFGPHTVTHPILSMEPEEVCRWEIEESYRRLRQETDACVPVLCYPNGEPRAFGRRELDVARRAGFRAALTTVPDYATSQCVRPWGALGRFALPRFPYQEDRPHVVHTVAGLPRLQWMVRGGRGKTLSEVMGRLAAMSVLCAGLPE